ncbi:hypothetical protein HPB47_009912 [Ixodes persulcatus]|uniref:Uncharacterized protein n=1 Tax=Ixodes persulcatus TaxID=34615 RepID=A0AC60P0H1_IXOPE|nr:hypothetical protein HPB47_009912 [Ixodes persulcatus]
MATSTGPTPPSPHSSHPASTDQYSLPSSVCGRSIAESEDKDTPMNSAEDITPAIASLNSLRLSNTLAKTFPECILEIRYNSRLNLVAVDVRNGQTTRGLLRCTELCGIKVRAYEPLPRQCATGVIKDVDTTLTYEEITNNLRSPENRVAPSSTLVLFGIQLLHPKRNLSNAASAAAMDTVRPPASTVLCASAAVTRTRTETPALLKRGAKREESSSTMQDTLTSKTENQRPKRPTYATLIKLPRRDEPKAPLTKEGPSSNRVNPLEDPKTTGSAPTDPRQRRTTRRRTLSVSTDTAPSKGPKDLTLLTDPSTPTRLGTSVARDTCPDLTMYRGTKPCTWRNLEEQLGSDHSILETRIHTKEFTGEARHIRITDWPAFRASSSSYTSSDTLTDWVQTLQTRLNRHTRTLTTSPDAPDIDSHLLHLWEARRSLTKRWRRQRHNKKLKRRIAQLTVDAADYAANLTGENWHALCDNLNGTLGTARTWSLLRHLIQPGQAKSDRAKGIHSATRSRYYHRALLPAWRPHLFPHKTDLPITITLDDKPVPRKSAIRVLGFTLQSNAKATQTLHQLTTQCNQIMHMLCRVSNRRHGLKEADALRLHLPYHNLTQTEHTRMSVLLRKAQKLALGLPVRTSTVCLERLGVTNTLEELIEAHRAAQLTRLRCTAQGRALLATLGFLPCPASLAAEGLSPAARARLTVAPIPRHMNPTRHSARRDHRSRYLRRAYPVGCGTVRALFTDASPQGVRGGIMVVVNSDLRTVHAATERGLTDVSILEERAVARAILSTSFLSSSIPIHILTDSQTACRYFLYNTLHPSTASLLDPFLSSTSHNFRLPSPVMSALMRSPEISHTGRLGKTLSASNQPLYSYSTHLAELRLAWQHYPPPHPSLTRRDAVLWRQLQTNTFPTPLFYSYLHPSLSPPQCPHCGDRPNLFHMVWQCQLIPAVPSNPNPTPTSCEERLTDDTAIGQQSLVDRAKAVAATYGAPD